MRILAGLLLVSSSFAADPLRVNPIAGGIVARQDWRPLTDEQRLSLFLQENFTQPGSYFRSFGPAIGDQLGDEPAQWDNTASAYLGRAALRYVNFTAQGAIEAGGSAVLGHEPRYVRCGCTGFWKRSGHAMLMNFVTYDDRGRLVPHVSRIAGAYASSLLVETMMPGRYDTWRAMRGGNGQMYFGGLFNMLREFGPEMKRGLRRLRPGR